MTPPTFTPRKRDGRHRGLGKTIADAMHTAEAEGEALIRGLEPGRAGLYITPINAWLGERRFTSHRHDDGVLIRCRIPDEAPLIKGGQGRDAESTLFAASLVLACVGIASATLTIAYIWWSLQGGAS